MSAGSIEANATVVVPRGTASATARTARPRTRQMLDWLVRLTNQGRRRTSRTTTWLTGSRVGGTTRSPDRWLLRLAPPGRQDRRGTRSATSWTRSRLWALRGFPRRVEGCTGSYWGWPSVDHQSRPRSKSGGMVGNSTSGHGGDRGRAFLASFASLAYRTKASERVQPTATSPPVRFSRAVSHGVRKKALDTSQGESAAYAHEATFSRFLRFFRTSPTK